MAGFDEARARHALDQAGLDFSVPMTRTSSVTNEVWLTDDHAIRVNRRIDQRLRREASLAPCLPPVCKYPKMINHGGQLGADWLILERCEGEVLSRCWPEMTTKQRREAVRQLAMILRVLHTSGAPNDLPSVKAPQLLSPPGSFGPAGLLLEGITRAYDLEFVDKGVLKSIEGMVKSGASALDPWNATTLIHGDLHFENILWDGQEITALLDFEYSRPGPSDLELDVFLRACAYPFLHVAPVYQHLALPEHYVDVPFWLGEFYPEIFEHPRQFERVRLYAIAYCINDLLADPPTGPPRTLWEYHACNQLDKIVRGESHIDAYRGASVA